jgi:hypothetical protein
MNLGRVLALVHLLMASLYLLFVLIAPWAKRGDDEGVFSATGGAGFGIIAVILGVLLVALALMRLAGRHHVLPGLGVEQLTIGLGLAAVANLIGFVVGWLAVFPAGTGWAIVAAYFPASFIPQIGLLTISAAEPPAGVQPLDAGTRRGLAGVALLSGLGIALFPFLTWLSAGSIDLTGFSSGAGRDFAGPRLSYILLIVGAAVILASAMRLRPQGLAEPGPALLLSHATFGAGLVAVLLPLSTLVSAMRVDGLDPGIGIWLGLLVGLVLCAVGLFENAKRGAVAV